MVTTEMPVAAPPKPPVTPDRILRHLVASQHRPDLNPYSPEARQRIEQFEAKTKNHFGRSEALLLEYGLKKEDAQKLAEVLTEGEWLFENDVSVAFHEPVPVSDKRRHSGQEVFNSHEIPSVEFQFTLGAMIEKAVKQAGMEPRVAQKIMQTYATRTRYRDFGLAVGFPANDGLDHPLGEPVRLQKLKGDIQDTFTHADSAALIMGGWTSGITFARSADPNPTEPENEANLSQRYLSRKQEERKKAFVVSCSGPGMENNKFTDEVDYEHPFGPHDHALGAAEAVTLLGIGNSDGRRELCFEGHSMSGAAGTAYLREDFSDSVSPNLTIYAPANAGSNRWANWAEQSSDPEAALLRKAGQKGLALTVSGFIDVLDHTAGRVKKMYTPLKTAISRFATGELFLPGDKKHMKQRVLDHVRLFDEHTDSSTLTALGSIKDIPLERNMVKQVMEDEDNPTKFVIITDRDDQMVSAKANLEQLPANVPLFVLDDHNEGSHYAFKRNCRGLRIGLLQQSMEQFNKPQFRYLHQELFMNAYQEKPQTAAEIEQMAVRDTERISQLFGVSKEEVQTYLEKRTEARKMLNRRTAEPFIASMAQAGIGEEEELRAHYAAVAGKKDFGMHYFYGDADRMSRAVMPENSNPGLGKVELMIETLEQLGTQVHFNLPSDPLFAKN